MKAEARVLDVTSTLEGERVGMSIDEGAMAHIMSILTDLYSDPELAVIREYSTNALDAHVEAGVNRPIEITLPSTLAPFFRVRDYGDGLDVEDIRTIYSRYGTSTKRDSNDVVGMLGLGCKSALTYSDQFTLTAIKNGICTQVSISREEDGSGSMTIVSEHETDDPSGVEVIVPVKRHNDFQSKASQFFCFWAEGTVLVNGVAPQRINGMWVADDLLITHEVSNPMIVMGNVAYPIPEATWEERQNPVVAFVPIGAVNFTPSRESLQMTAKTKSTLAEIRVRVQKERDAAFLKLIADASTHAEALALTREAYRKGFNSKKSGVPVYKGMEVPSDYVAGEKEDPVVYVNARKYRGDKGWSSERRVDAGSWNALLWLTGYDAKAFSPHKRKQLEQWKASKGITQDLNGYILLKEIPAAIVDWIDPANIHPWSEVAAQKFERARIRETDGRPTGSYKGFANDRYVVILAEEIDTTKPVLWGDLYCQNARESILNQHYPEGYTVVFLGENRIKKFQRDFPQAERVGDHCRKLAEKWFKSLTANELLMIEIHVSGEAQTLVAYDPDRIEDPDLKTAIKLAKAKAKVITKYDLYRQWVSHEFNWKNNPLTKYHLLTSLRTYGRMNKDFMEHLYTYINAAYAAGQES